MKSVVLGILHPISNLSPNHFYTPTPTPPMPSFTIHPSPSLSPAFRHPPRLLSFTPPPLGLRLPPLRRPPALLFSFTASHDDSSPTSIEVEKETNDLEKEADEPQDAWKETLSSFKEQALKMQTVSQEAYQVYSDRARVILKETSEKLKVQAEKARQELSVIASEISQEGKEYLSNAADNYPEPVKDIVETFASSTDDLKEVSKMRDFYLGIPYGALLSAGGFLSFMFTGSVSAVRFGVILGGTLLALSISSLRSWKKGESSSLALKGQAAICTILFLREVRLLFCRPFIANFITAFVSGVAVAFYAYRIIMDREQAQGSNLERGTES
ncbi:protein FATTY ACID EXPORT 3, chloroplastic isoform X2 [Coffea eugenioides]|uniref:protein FATTY ACID EXPORT 3, chloroplastic isoform X2 n=1 Tax=Coffea eugenioides TaxID=49369 RepID=UPI000F5CC3A2|nr:protein FATTY ACID EXPORT 3, chloroplastic-like isoform X2 [Coffea arabica]XP_027176098.1 protein FATTY ACID EXPORT 3, chloroplastic isoform X2 [Coffea eugenioides]